MLLDAALLRRVYASVPILSSSLVVVSSISLASLAYRHTPLKHVFAYAWRRRGTLLAGLVHVVALAYPSLVVRTVVAAGDAVALMEAARKGAETRLGRCQSWALCCRYAAGCLPYGRRLLVGEASFQEAKRFATALLADARARRARLAQRSCAGAAIVFCLAVARRSASLAARCCLGVACVYLCDEFTGTDTLSRAVRDGASRVAERIVLYGGLVVVQIWRCACLLGGAARSVATSLVKLADVCVLAPCRRAGREAVVCALRLVDALTALLTFVFDTVVEPAIRFGWRASARLASAFLVPALHSAWRASKRFTTVILLPALRVGKLVCQSVARQTVRAGQGLRVCARAALHWFLKTARICCAAASQTWSALIVPSILFGRATCVRCATFVGTWLDRLGLRRAVRVAEVLVFPCFVAATALRVLFWTVLSDDRTLLLSERAMPLVASCSLGNSAVLFFSSAFASPVLLPTSPPGAHAAFRRRNTAARYFALYGDCGLGRCVGNIAYFLIVTVILSCAVSARRAVDFVARIAGVAVRTALSKFDSVVRALGRLAQLVRRRLCDDFIAPFQRWLWDVVFVPIWSSPVATLACCTIAAALLVAHHDTIAAIWSATTRFIVARLSVVASSWSHWLVAAMARRYSLVDRARTVGAVGSGAASVATGAVLQLALDIAAPSTESAAGLLASKGFTRVIVLLEVTASAVARCFVCNDVPQPDPVLAIAIVRLFVKAGLLPVVVAALLPHATRGQRALLAACYGVGAAVVAKKALADDRDAGRSLGGAQSSAVDGSNTMRAQAPLIVRLAAAFLPEEDDTCALPGGTCPICLEDIANASQKSMKHHRSVAVNSILVSLHRRLRPGLGRILRHTRTSKPQFDNERLAVRLSAASDDPGCVVRLRHHATRLEETVLVGERKKLVLAADEHLNMAVVRARDEAAARLQRYGAPLAVATLKLDGVLHQAPSWCRVHCDTLGSTDVLDTTAISIQCQAHLTSFVLDRRCAVDIARDWAHAARPPKPEHADCLVRTLHGQAARGAPCTLACTHQLHFGCLADLTASRRCNQRCPLCREPVILPSTIGRFASDIWF